MNKIPEVSIDLKEFWHDPYPKLQEMRSQTPICFVPELNAVLLTRRDDIFTCEKNIEIFSSQQPKGLMTVLMGENLMRKDGEDHQRERKELFPSVSPRTVRDTWAALFKKETAKVITGLADKDAIDLVTDFAMPVSGHALRHITGLTQLTPQEMDQTSQHMIDGVGNYIGNPEVEARCHAATEKLDAAIDEKIKEAREDTSIVSVLSRAGQGIESIRANVKLAISGGQNEPRDAIAGCAWALMSNPDQLDKIQSGEATWLNAFEEYSRWMSPIGMTPREITKDFVWNEVLIPKGSRAFLMFGSANRDQDYFDRAEEFQITRDTRKAISFGSGPHFCAGAAASRSLIADVALPQLFEAFPNMTPTQPATFGGWAFRGPLQVPVRLH